VVTSLNQSKEKHLEHKFQKKDSKPRLLHPQMATAAKRMMITLTGLMQHGNTAVVTGASSGIGRAAALAFAKAGMHVWMVDVDVVELTGAQKMVKQHKVDEDQLILAERVDVSDSTAMELLAQQVFENTGKCHVLMNNAGIGLS
jgi:NADP-dependent 3-hydroxy acid dehydrogenase YdfG